MINLKRKKLYKYEYVIIIYQRSQNVHKKDNLNSTLLPTMHAPPTLPDNLIHKGGVTSIANLGQDLH